MFRSLNFLLLYVNAPKQKRIEKPDEIKVEISSPTSKDSVECISVTGRLILRAFFNFKLKDKLSDQITLISRKINMISL